MSGPSCPTCKKPVLPRAENPAFPFCSQRCRAVDLGKWLGEEFKVVDTAAELDEDGTQPFPDDESGPEDLH